MGCSSFLALTLSSLLLFHVCTAQFPWQSQQPQQQQRRQSQCRLDNLNALNPDRKVESEAGLSEYWDENNDQFQCAGVAAVRHTIQRNGLLLPVFTNAPQLVYVVKGRGIHGAALPGCPETFQSPQTSQSRQQSQSRGSQQRPDEHQKVRQIREGDILALPAGVPSWIYNNGESQLVLVSFIDIGNEHNQLDQNARRFYLAGNPRKEQQTRQEQQGRSQSQQSRQQGDRSRSRREQQQENSGNIFSGFDERLLAEALNIEPQLARKLQSPNDQRERIVLVKDELDFLSPAQSPREQRRWEEEEDEDEEEEQRGRRHNGLEETICSLRLRHNIDRPSQADVFNPQGGRLTTVNSYNLPILNHLQISAQRGVLYKNAIIPPHYQINSHSVVYVTKGRGRLQIVDDNGNNVFDDDLREGQILVLPQNFVVLKRASNEGFEWIALRTNDNAKIQTLSGRISAIRAMPDDVLANAFQLSNEQVRRLKYNREELAIFSPSQSQGRN